MTVTSVRTHAAHPDFISLTAQLDGSFFAAYGDAYRHYLPFNGTADLLLVVLVYADGIPAACGGLRRIDDNTAELKRLFVCPSFRRRGLAQRVVRELEDAARAQGFTRTVLETGADMTPALKLYRKLGYVSIEGYGPYAGDKNCACMAKEFLEDDNF